MTELLACLGGCEVLCSFEQFQIEQRLNIMTNTQEETNDAMKAKKDLIEQRMKDRQNERDTDRYIDE